VALGQQNRKTERRVRILLLPIDQRRRDEIAAAIAAHDIANPQARLPRNAMQRLATRGPI
jgi:hypothetical protein